MIVQLEGIHHVQCRLLPLEDLQVLVLPFCSHASDLVNTQGGDMPG